MHKVIKEWLKLVSPSKSVMLFSFATNLVCTICSIAQPIALSHFTSFASEHNLTLALLWLGINFLLYLMENISWHLNYSNYTKLIGPAYINLSTRLSSSLLNGSANTSDKESFNYVQTNDIFTISTFSDLVILRVCGLIKLVTILTIIFVYNYYTGLLVVISCTIGFFLLLAYSKTKNKASSKLMLGELSTDRKFDEIYDKREVIKKLNLSEPVIFEQSRRLKGYVESYSCYTQKRSIKDNCIKIYWYTALTAIFAILIYQLANLQISLAVFLVLITYTSSFTQITENAFDFTIEFAELNNSIERFNTALSKGTDQIPQAPQIATNKIKIKAKTTLSVNEKTRKHIMIEYGGTYLFSNKKFQPIFEGNDQDKWTIFAEGEPIKSIYNVSNLLLASQNDPLFSDSLKDNFLVLCSDMGLIEKTLSALNLDEFINSLERGLDSWLPQGVEEDTMFKINLARAVLCEKNFIVIKNNPLGGELFEILHRLHSLFKSVAFIVFDASPLEKKPTKEVSIIK